MKKIKLLIRDFLLFFLPIRKIILFESFPNTSDNTKSVFNEMIKKGVNKKYKLVWRVTGDFIPPKKIKNVKYVNVSKNKIKWRYYLATAKAMVCCNQFLVPLKRKQISFYLSHGTPLKSVRNYYNIPNSIGYSFATAEKIKDIYSYELNVDINKVIALGYPRNDELTNNKVDVNNLLNTDCEKVIVWYPTFRQHNCGVKTGVKNGLPVLHDAKVATELNGIAKQNNVLIVLKPHFVQDVRYIKDLNLSNIRFINDEFFKKNNVSSYSFVGSCDALITDYSSIYYDFTICNKPIAVVWEDIEEYKLNPGLIENYEYWAKGAEKVYNLEDFKKFIVNVAQNNDILTKERNEICDLVNYSRDGKNSERVTNFILEKMDFKK